MSHATVAVIIKDKIDDNTLARISNKKVVRYSELPIDTAKAILEETIVYSLAPFDESIEVPVYISMTKEDIIKKERERLAQYAKDKEEYLNAPKDNKPKWNPGYVDLIINKLEILQNKSDEALYKNYIQGYEDDLDENGNLLSTYNPKSKWDWYEIGGRWNNNMYTKEKNEDGTSKSTNICQLKDLDLKPIYIEDGKIKEGKFSTYAILDSNGEWHEAGKLGWWGISNATDEEEEKFKEDYNNLLLKEDQNNWIVLVDYHI